MASTLSVQVIEEACCLVASALGYISEGSVSHINGVRPSFLEYTAVSRFVTFLRMLHTW